MASPMRVTSRVARRVKLPSQRFSEVPHKLDAIVYQTEMKAAPMAMLISKPMIVPSQIFEGENKNAIEASQHARGGEEKEAPKCVYAPTSEVHGK